MMAVSKSVERGDKDLAPDDDGEQPEAFGQVLGVRRRPKKGVAISTSKASAQSA